MPTRFRRRRTTRRGPKRKEAKIYCSINPVRWKQLMGNPKIQYKWGKMRGIKRSSVQRRRWRRRLPFFLARLMVANLCSAENCEQKRAAVTASEENRKPTLIQDRALFIESSAQQPALWERFFLQENSRLDYLGGKKVLLPFVSDHA